jgi:PAS domain-containing protein
VTPAPDSRTLNLLRREIAFAVDADGCVTWADQAAEAMLGASIGAQFVTYAAPDQLERVQALVADGIREKVENRDVVLMVNGRPVTLTFDAVPTTEGTVLVGTVIPHEYVAAARGITETAQQIGALTRESERQQLELLRRSEELSRLNRDLDDSARA